MSNKVYQLHGKNYLLFDEESGRITTTYDNKVYDDCFLLPVEAYYGLMEELFQMFGADYWLILQKAGEGAGRVSARSFQNTDADKIAEAIKNGFNGKSRWGFGLYKLKELDIQKKHVMFELHDSALEYNGNNSRYKRFVEEQHFLVGFYIGLFSTLFNNRMRCTCSRVTDNTKIYYKFEVNPAFEEHDNIPRHGSIIKKDTARANEQPPSPPN